MSTFNGFPEQVYAATLTGSNGIIVTGSLSPNKITVSLGEPITISGSNFGISTTDPLYPLDVNGQVAIRGNIFHSSSNSNYQAEIGPGAGTSNLLYYGLYVPNEKIINLQNGINGSPWVNLILSGSRVGIGTYTPDQTLTVQGSISLAGEVIQPNWIAPTFYNEFENYDINNFSPAGYKRTKDGFVHLRGLLCLRNIPDGELQGLTIFILPKGYRPDKRKTFIIHANNSWARLDIRDNGIVSVERAENNWYEYFSLEGISFDTN